MKNQLKFFLKVNKLKTMQRTGWVLREVKNPETIAEHTFRVAIVAWLLGQKKNLNTEQLIKTALFHDLCEVYAGDLTPFFYYLDLPKDEIKRKEMLKKWVRLSRKEKKKRGKKKNEIEKKSLLRLIKSLKPEIQKEIYAYWHDFEKRISPEGKFLRPVDKIETLLQAIEYFGAKEDTPVTGWWEEVEEMAEDPLLLDFLAVIQNSFYQKRKSLHQVADENLKQELGGIVRFLLEVGKLKRFPRRIWRLLEVKSPIETVADHIFSVALMAWIFGRQKPELRMKKLLKMALCHELAAVYTNDLTPYDGVLTKSKKKKEVFKKWLRLPRKEKEKIHLEHYRKERAALEKLTSKLGIPLRKEILQLFYEYKSSSTAEARFLNQVNVSAVLLQALLYWKKDKNLQVDWMWEWAFEKCEDPIILEFLDALKEKFY